MADLYINTYKVHEDTGPFRRGWFLVYNPTRKDGRAIQAIEHPRLPTPVATFGPEFAPDLCIGLLNDQVSLLGSSPALIAAWSRAIANAKSYDARLEAI